MAGTDDKFAFQWGNQYCVMDVTSESSRNDFSFYQKKFFLKYVEIETLKE